MSELSCQAVQVFERKAFKLVVWVGVFGSFSRGTQQETSDVDIVIFYNPDYSEKQVWNCLLAARKPLIIPKCRSGNGILAAKKNHWGTDPDEPKLEQVWGRKVDIVRIFAGVLRYEKDVEAILHAQTIYGSFSNPALEGLRSSYSRRVEEYQRKINDSEKLASKSEDSSKVGNAFLQWRHLRPNVIS